MKVIDIKYDPITGAICTFVEVPDYKVISSHNANAAAAAYQRSQQIREKHNARMRKNNMKQK